MYDMCVCAHCAVVARVAGDAALTLSCLQIGGSGGAKNKKPIPATSVESHTIRCAPNRKSMSVKTRSGNSQPLWSCAPGRAARLLLAVLRFLAMSISRSRCPCVVSKPAAQLLALFPPLPPHSHRLALISDPLLPTSHLPALSTLWAATFTHTHTHTHTHTRTPPPQRRLCGRCVYLLTQSHFRASSTPPHLPPLLGPALTPSPRLAGLRTLPGLSSGPPCSASGVRVWGVTGEQSRLPGVRLDPRKNHTG
jgi:hypothetical protein